MAAAYGERMHFRTQKQKWDEANISFGSVLWDCDAFDKAACIFAGQEVIK
jgi:hypothetical protein